MGKAYTFVVALIGITILLNLAGYQTASTSLLAQVGITLNGGVLDGTGMNTPEGSNTGWGFFMGFFSIVALGSIVVGYLSNTSSIDILKMSFVIMLIGVLTADVLSIIGMAYAVTGALNWMAIVIGAILLPITAGMWISLIAWAGGHDN